MNNKLTQTQQKEDGVVSIFSVIFFIIISSVIAVGFIRIVNIEQQQATDYSSSANALAAARAGIEDGKRVLLLQKRHEGAADSLQSALDSAIGNERCDAILGKPLITSALGIDSSGKVYQAGEDGGQYYTCLTVEKYTADYQNIAGVGRSVIVPIKPESSGVERLNFQWHRTSHDGQVPSPLTSFSGNPSVDDLSVGGEKVPSHMRLQLIKVPKADLRVTSIASSTGFLGTMMGIVGATTPLSLSDDSDTIGSKNSPTIVTCSSGSDYACRATVSTGPLDTGANDYYLRVTALHRDTSFRVEMLDSSDSVVKFDGVQPIVDATGKSGSTFRRLRSRVSFSTQVDLPEYVAESLGDPDDGSGSGEICKNVLVGSPPSSSCWH